MHTDTTAGQLLGTLWQFAGQAPDALEQLSFSHLARQLSSQFPVGALASAVIGAQALAAAEFWRLRGGSRQTVAVDQRHALSIFRSERYLLINGKPPADPWSPIAGYYQAGDGRWIQLHTNFPHHRDGVLRVLQCADNRAAVAAAIAGWQATELDARLAQEGMCAALIRSPDEWLTHPQATAIAGLPLFEIERIADSGPEMPRPGQRPLSGVRVLDLSRVIAAPVAGRTLAQHGAEVLAIGAAHLPNIPTLVIDNGRGKRAAQLDLRSEAGRQRLRQLIRGADVFLHAYRPGALAAHGFSSDALQALRPGLVEVRLSAYGHAGPWAERRGFDSLVQSATGIAWEEGKAAGSAQPGKLPCQALDHATGYLAAFCAMIGLRRRATEGGGWRVQVSLAQTGRWLQSMPRLADGLQHADLSPAEVDPWRQTIMSSYGELSAIAPAEQMSATPPHFDLPPSALDAYEASWQQDR
ncbi:CoA transferase [Collimonas pratensis]|uniref:CoA-transferase III family protein n=1 Tax=Collimonas pratensis TaxID=279113 RepID=A0ABM5ZB73_9BURK|nr:CoA transferase [Collimonas pratensis]AMP16105.1 coA-transferase III family protein [Collimonas pratensis]